MSNQVTIIKNKKTDSVFTAGTAINPKTGKAYGFYLVEKSSISMEGGFITEDKRTALLTVDNELAAKVNFTEGQKVGGIIQRTESKTPFYDGQEPVINPTTKESVLRGGAVFYRQDQYTADVTAKDVLVARDLAPAVELGVPMGIATSGVAQ